MIFSVTGALTSNIVFRDSLPKAKDADWSLKVDSKTLFTLYAAPLVLSTMLYVLVRDSLT